MIYTSQSDIMKYLDTARVDDVIITTYQSPPTLRIVTGVLKGTIDFRSLCSDYVIGSYDKYAGSWDCGGVRSLEYLGNGLDNVKQTHPELFI